MLWRPDNHLPMKKLLLSALLLLTGSLFANERIARLRCEEMTDPIGIDVLQPRLSWELESDRRGVLQTAYRILVATDKTLLDRDQGDMWDSGEIESDATSGIKYAGKPLQRNSYYYWKVKANTNKGETAWSEPALWQVGLLQFQDWVGQWIGFDPPLPVGRRSARFATLRTLLPQRVRLRQGDPFGDGLYHRARILRTSHQRPKNRRPGTGSRTDRIYQKRKVQCIRRNGRAETRPQRDRHSPRKRYVFHDAAVPASVQNKKLRLSESTVQPGDHLRRRLLESDLHERLVEGNGRRPHPGQQPVRRRRVRRDPGVSGLGRAGIRRRRMAAGRVRPGAGRNLRGADDRPDEGRKRTRPRLRNGENGRPGSSSISGKT